MQWYKIVNNINYYVRYIIPFIRSSSNVPIILIVFQLIGNTQCYIMYVNRLKKYFFRIVINSTYLILFKTITILHFNFPNNTSNYLTLNNHAIDTKELY